MIGVDISIGADLAGSPPIKVLDADHAQVEPITRLPRFSVQGDFLIPSQAPTISAVVSVVATEWTGAYALGIPYEATVFEGGIDLAFRVFPYPESSEAYTGPRVRPWGEVGLGGRGIGLFQPWWSDIDRLGMAVRTGVGVNVGNQHRHFIVGARYEAMLAGAGVRGILDSAAQDMKWIWTPSAGRIFVTLGGGWR